MIENRSVTDAPAMTVSALSVVLKAASDLPITVVWPDGEPIEAHFHVTEIGRVQRDFVDCGGSVHRVVSCLLQTWIGADVEHRITGAYLLKALAHAIPILRGEDLPVELEYETCDVVQMKVASAAIEAGSVVIQLGTKHTDCIAKELCVPSSLTSAAKNCC